MLLQQKIDDVLASVRLSDLLHEESEVRARVGLEVPLADQPADAERAAPEVRALPILGAR